MAGFLMYWTYKVLKKINGALGYYRTVMLKVTIYSMMWLLFIQMVLFKVPMYSKIPTLIRSNGSHFLTAGFLV